MKITWSKGFFRACVIVWVLTIPLFYGFADQRSNPPEATIHVINNIARPAIEGHHCYDTNFLAISSRSMPGEKKWSLWFCFHTDAPWMESVIGSFEYRDKYSKTFIPSKLDIVFFEQQLLQTRLDFVKTFLGMIFASAVVIFGWFFALRWLFRGFYARSSG